MAKKQAFTLIGLTGSVTVTYYTGAVFAQGTLLELSDESVTLSVKRPRSSKRDMLTVALDRVTYASLSAEENEAYIAYRGEESSAFEGVTVTQIVNGALMGTIGDEEYPFIAASGTWTSRPKSRKMPPKSRLARKRPRLPKSRKRHLPRRARRSPQLNPNPNPMTLTKLTVTTMARSSRSATT